MLNKDIADNYNVKRSEILKEIGIKDVNVLNAIAQIPRHLLLESSFEDFAYQNKAFPIGADQTISHPYTVAFQSELLQVAKGDKILEILLDGIQVISNCKI